MQLADFGSSRSATQDGYHFAEQGPPEPTGWARASVSSQVIHVSSWNVYDMDGTDIHEVV